MAVPPAGAPPAGRRRLPCGYMRPRNPSAPRLPGALGPVRVVRVRVGRVMVMVVVVAVMVVVIGGLEPAEPGAERVAKLAIGDVRAGRGGALPLDVVMVAFLNRADLVFESENLGAILAHRAIRR